MSSAIARSQRSGLAPRAAGCTVNTSELRCSCCVVNALLRANGSAEVDVILGADVFDPHAAVIDDATESLFLKAVTAAPDRVLVGWSCRSGWPADRGAQRRDTAGRAAGPHRASREAERRRSRAAQPGTPALHEELLALATSWGHAMRTPATQQGAPPGRRLAPGQPQERETSSGRAHKTEERDSMKIHPYSTSSTRPRKPSASTRRLSVDG